MHVQVVLMIRKAQVLDAALHEGSAHAESAKVQAASDRKSALIRRERDSPLQAKEQASAHEAVPARHLWGPSRKILKLRRPTQ